jgi:nucleoside diphosphate kinase
MSNIFYYEAYLVLIFQGIVILKGKEALTGKKSRNYTKLREKIFFNGLLEFCTTGFIPMVLATFMNFQVSLKETIAERIAYNNAIAISILIYGVYPLIMIYCLWVDKE